MLRIQHMYHQTHQKARRVYKAKIKARRTEFSVNPCILSQSRTTKQSHAIILLEIFLDKDQKVNSEN